MKEIKITENEAQQRLDRFLRKYLKEYSLGDIYKLFRKNKVKINRKKVKENYMLCVGDVLQLFIEDITTQNENIGASLEYSNSPIDIIYEDENLLLVNKPIGLLTHPDKPGDNDTLIGRALGYFLRTDRALVESPTFKPSVCNRLDRNTGGIVMIAKNYTTLKQINEMIRQRNIKKLYKCIVVGKLIGTSEIKGFLHKDEKENIVTITENEVSEAKAVHTIYKAIKSNSKYSLMEVELITGRSHQIRASFAFIGHPLIGDTKYGNAAINQHFKEGYKLKHQYLYAYLIEFEKCSEELSYLESKRFTCSMPENMAAIEKDLF